MIGRKGQTIPLDNPIGIIVFIVILIAVTGIMMTVIAQITCKAERNEISALNNKNIKI